MNFIKSRFEKKKNKKIKKKRSHSWKLKIKFFEIWSFSSEIGNESLWQQTCGFDGEVAEAASDAASKLISVELLLRRGGRGNQVGED